MSEPDGPDEENSSPSKRPKPNPAPSDAAIRLADQLRTRIVENNPRAKISDHQVEKWAREADLMLRRDQRTAEEIQTLINWCQADSFWRANILSMGALRKHFDQLTVKMKTPPKAHGAAVESVQRPPYALSLSERMEQQRRLEEQQLLAPGGRHVN